MKKKIKFGIIGCSSIAERNTIPAILQSRNAELGFIGSRSIEKAKQFSKQFTCFNYGNYDEVLEQEDIDAVYISLPIGLQEKWILKAANHGKHILCEKSAITSYKSAKKVVDTCKKNKVHVLEGFSFVYHPQHDKIIKIMKQGKIGNNFSFSSKFGFDLPFSNKNFRFKKSLGGGALNDIGCYMIRASNMVFQSKPLSINCTLFFDKKKEIDLKGSILIEYENNRIAIGLFSYCDMFQSTYEIWGSKGIISLERAFNIRKNMKAKINIQTTNNNKSIQLAQHDQFELMINEFCKKLSSRTLNNLIFEKELLDQALIMDKARKSSRMKKTLVFD
jgi:predicted dehydrogenase